jgi:hypothetical protein
VRAHAERAVPGIALRFRHEDAAFPAPAAAFCVADLEFFHHKALRRLSRPKLAAIGGILDSLLSIDDFNCVFDRNRSN